MSDTVQTRLIALTADIVSGYLGRSSLSSADLPALISTVHQSLAEAGQPPVQAEAPVDIKPAVPIKKSITPDYLVCLEDGKKLKMLKRHLLSSYGLTPDEYRTRWGLPSDYPMVAPNYSKVRSESARKVGLGRKKV